ncbi:MAG TPA: hypothetical protein VFC44_15400, partial [Candidatus Saccharimonadales bacterium]|nr:hypothetical protein [Candidatus Saccharimonadales bacterium]
KMKSLLPQCFVPVRYAHLHCALGEEDNQQQQSTTMFKVPNLFQDLTKNILHDAAITLCSFVEVSRPHR